MEGERRGKVAWQGGLRGGGRGGRRRRWREREMEAAVAMANGGVAWGWGLGGGGGHSAERRDGVAEGGKERWTPEGVSWPWPRDRTP